MKRIARYRQSLPENLVDENGHLKGEPKFSSSSRLNEREMTEPSEIPSSAQSHRQEIRFNTAHSNAKNKPKSEIPIKKNIMTENLDFNSSKTSKYSTPKGVKNLNLAFNTKVKRASEAQIYDYDYSYSKPNFVLSTRSAADRQQYQQPLNFNTEGNEIQRPKGPKFNKESLKIYGISEAEENTGRGDKIVTNLLKGYNLKEVNPNAKFLELRKQLHRKRDQTVFKSADWNTFNSNQIPDQKQKSTHVQTSPNRPSNSTFSRSPPRKEGNLLFEQSSREHLFDIFLKTKKVLLQYKMKEQDWKNERVFFVQEIQRLQNIIDTELKYFNK